MNFKRGFSFLCTNFTLHPQCKNFHWIHTKKNAVCLRTTTRKSAPLHRKTAICSFREKRMQIEKNTSNRKFLLLGEKRKIARKKIMSVLREWETLDTNFGRKPVTCALCLALIQLEDQCPWKLWRHSWRPLLPLARQAPVMFCF